ncbi:NitT/TauT family transport system substrate-binding protein [Rhizobiales bacterium GAS191]|nr:NitT/TauT family transport system substrate-binding protein [Rhizobiales bacterium GAS113]SEE10036.1 NitT/TauT family transport system substrate-binding protein [Rhizobiales bacterium GAS188]SEE46892.1 NitT/TauT family transport system substrate-binding protein [Rhizobiales bacterium GAS191]
MKSLRKMRLLRNLAFSGVLLTSLAAGAGLAVAAPPEKPRLQLGVGGKQALYYLPLTIAEQLGYFKDEGLDVTINDFGGGAKALQALVGGSVDVVTGAYEHTIDMQSKGQDVRAVIELGRFPAIVVLVKSEKAAAVKSPADLKGFKIGVTAPGSSTQFVVSYLIAKAGGNPADSSFIGVGAGPTAVAAMQKGEIDAISHIDPMISKLEADGGVTVLADTRSESGTRAIFGGPLPAAVLYAKKGFIDANPETTQRLVNAFVKALAWLAKASPEDVAKTVPEAYWLGDKQLYVKAVTADLEAYSRTGIIPRAGMETSLGMLKQFNSELAGAKIDLDKTFDDRFVRKATGAN